MIFWLLLIMVPVSIVAELLHASPLLVFILSAAAIVPLAEWIRRATEQIAVRTGSAIGGLLNVTFGNSAELILALFVLKGGHTEVVKATITGAIIGNSLLGLGLAILAGSRGRTKQTFKPEHAGLLGSLLILSVIALLIPALFDYTERGLSPDRAPYLDEQLSLGVSVVLVFVYIANLVYTLITHKDVFASEEDEEELHHAPWPIKKSIAVLLLATAAVSVEAEMVSGALEATAGALKLSSFFLGMIVLPFVGNSAEYFAAIYFAQKDKMGLVMTIAVGSTIQIALLTAPVLVLVSYAMNSPMNLVFSNPLELIAIAGVAFAVNSISRDGETTWFEGVLLLAVYAILVLAFFFVR
jgi:Ca2+:H+ antiporter